MRTSAASMPSKDVPDINPTTSRDRHEDCSGTFQFLVVDGTDLISATQVTRSEIPRRCSG
jgi:hypothetical protein